MVVCFFLWVELLQCGGEVVSEPSSTCDGWLGGTGEDARGN